GADCNRDVAACCVQLQPPPCPFSRATQARSLLFAGLDAIHTRVFYTGRQYSMDILAAGTGAVQHLAGYCPAKMDGQQRIYHDQSALARKHRPGYSRTVNPGSGHTTEPG